MIPKDAVCGTCGWFVLESPIGKSTKIVDSDRKACANWKPREVAE